MTAGECYDNPQEAAAEIKRLTASVAEYQKEQAADWCEINRLRELCKRQHEALKATMGMMDQYSYRMTMECRDGFDAFRVINAYKEFNK